jgi:hypothetical protein
LLNFKASISRRRPATDAPHPRDRLARRKNSLSLSPLGYSNSFRAFCCCEEAKAAFIDAENEITLVVFWDSFRNFNVESRGRRRRQQRQIRLRRVEADNQAMEQSQRNLSIQISDSDQREDVGGGLMNLNPLARRIFRVLTRGEEDFAIELLLLSVAICEPKPGNDLDTEARSECGGAV